MNSPLPHMCLSVDVRENFLSRFRPSCIKCGLFAVRKKRLLQFSQLLFTPLCLNLPTLHISPNFPHWEDGGDLKSKTLLAIQLHPSDPRFITFNTRSTAVAVECPRFYLGGLCCCVSRHFCPGSAVAVQEGIHRRPRKIKERAKWPFGLDGWLAFYQLLLLFGFYH